uniref:POU domain protein n=1 Tax=Strigamia maritima TaxID=126957 RepID=T1JCE7_STRMM
MSVQNINSTASSVFPSQQNITSAKMMNGKSPLHPSLGSVTASSCFGGRYSPTYRPPDSMRRCMPNPPAVRRLQLPPHHPHAAAPGDGYPRPTSAAEMDYTNSSLRPRQCLTNLFGGLEEGLLSRAEALAAMDISKHSAAQSQGLQLKHDMMYHHHHPGMTGAPPNGRPQQLSHHMDGMDMLDSLSTSTMPPGLAPISSDGGSASHAHHALSGAPASVYSSHGMNQMMTSAHHLASHAPTVAMHDSDSDPRELEAFAERFKQRRIKLGVTQADVGKALANLKLPGVGALSQSTICRFESLTLSHNNMIALKPVLQAWLEEAEAQARNKRKDPEAPDVLPSGEKKRKRTSIAAPEKRSLEAYFAVQPRPSGEKIAAIAEKLDLKKNVVRVWFCNQRQKQKRMKFSAVNHVVNH